MLKDKLQSIVKPNVVWTITVILVALCVYLYALGEQEKTLRISTEKELSKTVKVRHILEIDLVKVKKELMVRGKQIKLTLDKLEVAIKENEALEGKIKEMAAQSSNVDLQKIVVKAPPQ